MTVLAIVQARMASTRLPGKVLADAGGQPLLGIMLRRLHGLAVTTLVVATSASTIDDPIQAFCDAVGVPTVRGPEDDVLARFRQALDRHPADTVVRLTADCPLADPALIAEAIELHERSGADYTSNTLIRTYPDGLDVEVLRAVRLREADAEARDPVEREHVTPFVYRRPERFRLTALRTEPVCGDERWTVDIGDDLDLVGEVLHRRPDWQTAGWQQILATLGRRSRPRSRQLVLRPAVEADRDRVLAWRNDPMSVGYSRSGSKVTESDHRAWFALRLESPGGRLWIADIDGRPVGQVRVDVTTGVGQVAFAVDPGCRGQGYGTEILRRLGTTLGADYQVQLLRAFVNRSNEPSERAFLAAGYLVVDRDGDFIIFERQR